MEPNGISWKPMEVYGTPYNPRKAHGVVTKVTWKPSEKLSNKLKVIWALGVPGSQKKPMAHQGRYRAPSGKSMETFVSPWQPMYTKPFKCVLFCPIFVLFLCVGIVILFLISLSGNQLFWLEKNMLIFEFCHYWYFPSSSTNMFFFKWKVSMTALNTLFYVTIVIPRVKLI